MRQHSDRRLRPGWLRLLAAGPAVALVAIIVWGYFRQPPRPHVLLITLDTTRADRIGCYGYTPAETPTLDSLAANGTLFEKAYTPAPLTLPAHASMMTALFPPEHGLLTNGTGRLPEQISTLAEVLRDAGYDTGAFVGSFVLHRKFGLERGFGMYDDDMTNTDPTPDGLHRQRDGAWVADAALKWLRDDRSQPFFCWIHFYDAHAPYLPHEEEFGQRFVASPYDGGIGYVNLQIRRLVTHLHDQGQWSRTLVIVVGDHGEGLGEHMEQEHGMTLYDDVLRVPWIWTGPGVAAIQHRVATPVSIADLRPTLLALLGIQDGTDFEGRSLAEPLQGRSSPVRDCYLSTDFPFLDQGWSPQRAVVSGDHKYIRSPVVELFDLRADPHELRNIATEQPELARELDERLLAIEQAFDLPQASAVTLTSRERRVLETLGYLSSANSTAAATDSDQSLPDVKVMLPVYNEVRTAQRMLNEGRLAEAELALRKIAHELPDYLPARLVLADALRRQKKYEESLIVSESVLDLDPQNSDAHFQLGNVLLELQQYERAEEEYRVFLAERPAVVEVLFNLAECQLNLGRLEDSETTLRELLDHDPLFVKAHVQLANLLFRQQRTGEAEDHYREALRYTPRSAEAHSNLALLLARQGRMDDAGLHFEQAAALAPDNADVHFYFGRYWLALGRSEDALAETEQALRLDPQHEPAKAQLQQLRSRGRQ